jgi:AAA+ ATPase superfamily predicted ATPase
LDEDSQDVFEEISISGNLGNQGKRKSFVYGRPVHPGEFFGRESELLTIFNRLRNRESTAIVGERRIGKTSLLLKISDHTTREYFLGDEANKIIVSLIDLQAVDEEYTPSSFWMDALEPIVQLPQFSSIKKSNYSNSSLRKLFTQIAYQGQLLVLLLDEYDRLLSHPNFKDPSFFAIMRSLSTITGGLAVITASRLTVAEMNTKGRAMLGEAVETSF